MLWNNANIALVLPGQAGSLGANKNLIIDTTAPTMTITASDAASGGNAIASGSYTNQSPIYFTFTSSEATANFVVGDITIGGATPKSKKLPAHFPSAG